MKQLDVSRNVASTVERKRRKCIRKFLYYFPRGYMGKKFVAWEREYKWNAHLAWQEKLNKDEYMRLLQEEDFGEIARRAAQLESKTNLLFSFEKMALRDAVKTESSAKMFSEGLYHYVYGKEKLRSRFESFRDVLVSLPVKQTRVLTWPLQTVFGFIANPANYLFLKPTVTKRAAEKYHYDFKYDSAVNWQTYESLLGFAALVRSDTAKWKPRDMIDLQSFIWVLGSEEYPD
jgi:hypothetical protein